MDPKAGPARGTALTLNAIRHRDTQGGARVREAGLTYIISL
jgi:hypothetical protein